MVRGIDSEIKRKEEHAKQNPREGAPQGSQIATLSPGLDSSGTGLVSVTKVTTGNLTLASITKPTATWATRSEANTGLTISSTIWVAPDIIEPTKSCYAITVTSPITTSITQPGFEQKTTVLTLTQAITKALTNDATATISQLVSETEDLDITVIYTSTEASFVLRPSNPPGDIPISEPAKESKSTFQTTSPPAKTSGPPVAPPTEIVFPNGVSFLGNPSGQVLGTFTTTAGGQPITFAILPSDGGAVVNGRTILPGSIVNLNGLTVGYEFSSIYIKTNPSGSSSTITTLVGGIPMTIGNIPSGLGAIVNGVSILPGATAVVNGITLSYGPSGLVTLENTKVASASVGGSNGGPFKIITLGELQCLLIFIAS